MSHPGAAPINPSTPVGQLRVLVGDTSSTDLVPPVAGQEGYAVWSDSDLEIALAVAGGSAYKAAGDLYAALAAHYAQRGRTVKSDDLQLNTQGRSGDLLAVARSFYAQADAIAQAEAGDFFQIVPFAGRTRAAVRPEATPTPLI